MTPELAVVGHPNKGKSSIVATPAENAQVDIGPVPGTTRHANRYTLQVAGEPLYTLIDTPGFQRAGQMHNWLTSQSATASARPELVRQFVDEHRDNANFADECTLLTPVLQGAGIIYVVDGSKPYGSEYELEMDILRWTGQPRMALINMSGTGDFRDEWRAGLGQYFSIVREFNAHQASFSQRIALLRAFAELEESWRAPLQRASTALENERRQQRQQASCAIADEILSALSARVEKPLDTDADDIEHLTEELSAQLTRRLQNQIRAAERRAQQEIQHIYHHAADSVSSQQLELLHGDLFTARSWQLFGLSRTQLAATGAVSGAIAGGSLDLLVGGTSFFLGSLLGGALGSATAWFGGPEIAKIKILGSRLGGDTVSAGPIREANFPWVLLGRACLHHALVSERNHAIREQAAADFDNSQNRFFDFLNSTQRNRIERTFSAIRKDPAAHRSTLIDLIDEVLASYQP